MINSIKYSLLALAVGFPILVVGEGTDSQNCESIENGEEKPLDIQELLDMVVAELGTKHYVSINHSGYRYPNYDEALTIHSPHFSTIKDTNDNIALRFKIGIDGSMAHHRIDEFLESGGTIECLSVMNMVILAIWRDILGDTAFDRFIVDIRDLETFFGDISGRIRQKNGDYHEWPDSKKVSTAAQIFYATKETLRASFAHRLSKNLVVDRNLVAILANGFMGYDQARGLLIKRNGKLAFGAPPGTFSYLANVPEYRKFHPLGCESGMNGLVTKSRSFIGFSPGHSGDSADYYANLHYESLLTEPCIFDLSEEFWDMVFIMAHNGRRVFMEQYFALNHLEATTSHWIWFHHEPLTEVYSRYVPTGNLYERLKSIHARF